MTDLPRMWLGCATACVEVDPEAMLTHRRRCACGREVVVEKMLAKSLAMIFKDGRWCFGDPAAYARCGCGHISEVHVWFGRMPREDE